MKSIVKKSLSIILIVTVFVNMFVWVDAANTEFEQSNPMEFNGHYYKIFESNMTWTDSELYCESLGGHLVTITTYEEQKKIEELMENVQNNCYWIGLTIENKTPQWVTDEEYKYSNWSSGNPDSSVEGEKYVHIYAVDHVRDNYTWQHRGEWNDLCNDATSGAGTDLNYYTKIGFICEWETYEDYNSKANGSASASGKGSIYVSKTPGAVTIHTKQSGYNENVFTLENVLVTAGAKHYSHVEGRDGYFDITKKELFGTEPVVLKKDGFKNYIIPCEILNSQKDGTLFDAYMELINEDEASYSKPYISTVFGKSNATTEYLDLTKNELVVEKDTVYTVLVSAVGLANPTYYIAQDYSHKIESNDGYFNSQELYSKLVPGKTVYAYAQNADGTFSDFQPINITKASDDGMLEKIAKTSTYSLGGSGGVTLTIPDENPVFGNSDISLKAFSAPITLYYDATSRTYIGTIGFDLYSYAQKDETVTNSNGKSVVTFGEGETKSAFKNFKESFAYFDKQAFAENKDEAGGLASEWKSFVKGCKEASATRIQTNDKNFSVDFLGYLEFTVNEQGFVVKEGSLKVGTEFSYSYTYQGAVWVIPAYFKTTLGASASLEGSWTRPMTDKELPFDFDITLNVEPNVALEAGVGVEKLAKLGVEVKGSAPISVEFTKKHFTMDFKGEINIKTKAFIFVWNKKLCDGELNVVDKYWGTATTVYSNRFGVPQYSVSANADITEDLIDYYNSSTNIAERKYLEDMSDWQGGYISRIRSGTPNEISIKELQTSVLEDGKPAVSVVGNKLLMTWIEDCPERDDYNRMRLVYSIYDGNVWSEPIAVFDDGKNDDAPVLVSDGENVYFAWQKINTVLDENSLVTESLRQVDICTATYSLDENKIVEAKVIYTGDGYDYAQTITLENGKPVIYFANCEDESVSTSFNSKINKYSDNTVSVLVTQLSFVQSIKANGDKMSYVIDTDGDLSTTNDINIFTYCAGRSTGYDKSNIEGALISSFYGNLDENDVLFVTDGSNIYYDLNGERKNVFASGRKLSSLNLVEWNNGPAFIWTEDFKDGSGNAVYFTFYKDNVWSEPVELYAAENYYFDALKTVNYNGDIVGGFMQDVLAYSEPNGNYSVTQVNLATVTIADHTNLTLGCVNAKESELVPGNTASLELYIENSGTEHIKDVDFVILDGIGEEQSLKVDVDLVPGEGRNITLNYIVPDGFVKTTLTVTAEMDYDYDPTDNVLEFEMGLPELHLVKYDYALNGDSYVIKAYVQNNSLTAAEKVKAKLYVGENGGGVFYDAQIESLGVDETGCAEFIIKKSALTFDEDHSARLFCCFEDKISKNGVTATECVLLTESADVCAHPETEKVGRVDSTCKEEGRETGVYCLACGEFVSGGEVIEPHHTAPETKAAVDYTCTENGYTAGVYCNDCNTWISGHETIKPHHTDENDDSICDACGSPSELTIKAGETKTVAVAKGETVYIAFRPTISGIYTFTTNSSSDTCGCIYSADMTQLTYNVGTENSRNFKATYHFDAGEKYYFSVRYCSSSNFGNFPVTLTLTKPDEPTLTPTNDSVTVDSVNRLIIGVPPKTASVSGILSVSDSDYTVTTSQGGYLGTNTTVTVSNGIYSYKYTVVVTNDLNGDGVVDVLDVTLSELITSGHFAFNNTNDSTGAFRFAADTNCDGETNVDDYTIIVNAALSGQ